MKLAINSVKGVAIHSAAFDKQAISNHVAMRESADKSGIIKPLILICLLILSPCGLAQAEEDALPLAQVKEDAGELINSIGYYTNTHKDEMVRDVDRVIGQLDKRIDSLQSKMESQWNDMSASARSQARATMDALRKQRIQVAEWYGGLKTSTYTAWDTTKQGFSDAYSELYAAWQQAEAEFSAN